MKKHGKSFRGRKTPNQERALVADKIPQRMPQVSDQLHTRMILRYSTTGLGGSVATSVTFQNILDSWLVATSATTASQLFDFVKINRITVRAVPYISGSTLQAPSCTVGVEFPGLVAGVGGSGNQASNTGEGTTYPAYVSLKPSRLSAASFWQGSSGNLAFVVRATNIDSSVAVGAIIDCDYSFKNSGDVNPASIASAVAGATTGEIYFGGIDGARLAATWARSVFIRRI